MGANPLDFENCSRKGCFLTLEWEKTKFTLLSSPRKFLEKSPCAPPEKNPSDAPVQESKSNLNKLESLNQIGSVHLTVNSKTSAGTILPFKSFPAFSRYKAEFVLALVAW